MKHEVVGLSGKDYREINRGSPVKLVQACLCAEKT